MRRAAALCLVLSLLPAARAQEEDDEARQTALRGIDAEAVAHMRAGRFAEAREAYERFVAKAVEWQSEAAESHGHGRLGTICYQLGDPEGALRHWTRAMEIREAMGDHAAVARALVNIGGMEAFLGRNASAIGKLERALAFHEERRDENEIGNSLGNLGIAYLNVGRYQDAVRAYSRALELKRKVGDAAGVAKAWTMLGVASTRLGDFARALDALDRGLQLAREAGDAQDVTVALVNLGTCRELLGDFDAAEAAYRESLRIAEERGLAEHEWRAHTLLGVLYERRGENEKFLAAQKRALAILGASSTDVAAAASVRVNLGVALDRLGRAEEALAAYAEAEPLLRASSNGEALCRLLMSRGTLHRDAGRLPEAEASLAEALRVAEDFEDRRGQAETLERMAELRLLRGDPEGAVELARRGSGIGSLLTVGLDSEAGAQAREHWAGIEELGARAAVLAGDADAALGFVEAGRAASLRESLCARDTLLDTVVPADLRAELDCAGDDERIALRAYREARAAGDRKEIREKRTALDEARARLQAAVERVERRARASADLVRAGPDSVDAIRGHLAEGQALVLYELAGDAALAVVVERKGVRVVPLGPEERVEEACDRLVGGKPPYVDESALPEARELLVAPLGLGSDVTRVLVSPKGRTAYVPWCLLLPAREVSLVPSGTVYGKLRAEAGLRGEDVLALGDPEYGSTPNPRDALLARGAAAPSPLPATRAEVEAIADVPLLGAGATEGALRKALDGRARWRAVHFACHGLVDPERPMLSALALAPTGEDGGFLTVLEVFRMRIRADLVVLSACDTGRGRIYRSEGVVGLARAFMTAGAPRVLCSLWKVDDAATQALMVRFYESWKPDEGEGPGAAAALEAAREFVRGHERWSHPYYWAGWVLWGLQR